ncbi:MAG: HD domain-containing protein [Acidobacteria bacterium]|nr:HD domain-containing protein [Acidobacteriota bacterium]
MTDLEVSVINHPLFQRLRHIRQNDVAFFVYPSLNISRFEHSLGCAHVAGKMAVSMTRSALWPRYQETINLETDDFEQVCRLYALLHDAGHLPLSHLFEIAFEDFAHQREPDRSLVSLCEEWFGGRNFTKLHESCGSAVAARILGELKAARRVRECVLTLMRSKSLPLADPLRPIKSLIDSEIDADRIDSTARDGLLAGREYGTYDIERLCSSVTIQRHGDGWRLAYSHKALGSIEALMLDRYRTHTWIHFHHRVVAMKVATAELITRLLGRDIITKESFALNDKQSMPLRDDIWLWSLLRDHASDITKDPVGKAASAAVFFRDTCELRLLWKNRTEYNEWNTKAMLSAGKSRMPVFKRDYEESISRLLKAKVVTYWVKFKPVGDDVIPLSSEQGDKAFGDLAPSSRLIGSLAAIWEGEPQYYVVLLGPAGQKMDDIRKAWVKHTAEWMAR